MKPEPFLWGVATSAYQSEGGYNGVGEPQTNWASAEARGTVVKTGAAAEFWTRFKEDFARCRELGLNAFRLGIEWSRVQPALENAPGPPPPFDFKALDHYAGMLAECRACGLEPVVTLHHFVHPAWLGPDPWFDAATPGLFTVYVKQAVSYLNRQLITRHGALPLRYFITINEPNMLVLNTYLGNQFPSKRRLGFTSVIGAYNGLLTGHVLAYNAIHNLYEAEGWPPPWVTFNNYCSDLYWSDKVLLDLVCVAERRISRNEVKEYIHVKIKEFEDAFQAAHIPLHKDIPFYFGDMVKRISNWLGYRQFTPEAFGPALAAIYDSPRPKLFDYIGLDYYDPFAAHAFRLPALWDHEFKNKSFRSWVMNTITSKWWDWRVLPRGLHFFCGYYSRDFARPVLIAENGMALRRRADNQATHRTDRLKRSQFLRLHVHEVCKILNDGIPLLGYLHWSLFDNYEWGSLTPRFGLYSIDYTKGSDRLPEDQLGDRPAETYAELIKESCTKILPLLVLCFAVNLLLFHTAAAEPKPEKLAAPPGGKLYNGFFYDGRQGDEALEHNVTESDVARYEAAVGEKAAYVYFSQQWFEGERFPLETCRWINGLGKVPYIRLMTWSRAEESKREPHYTLPAIIDGKFDKAFRTWADAARDFGAPLIVEWGVECNCRWFPWNGDWYGGEKTGPARFVAAYRRIVTLMREEGATNITWVWHINNSDDPEAPWNRLENYYPGDGYVDWIGVSDYGARTPLEREDLPAFRDQMDGVYGRITALAPSKPILVSEFGCTAGNSSLDAGKWANDALSDLFGNRWPRIAGFCWWNEIWENDDNRQHDTDMIIMDDPALTAAFRSQFDRAAARIQEKAVFTR